MVLDCVPQLSSTDLAWKHVVHQGTGLGLRALKGVGG